MEIKRVNTYTDDRFSPKVLLQHGCFLAGEEPYEVEILSDDEAVIRGKKKENYPAVIDEFRFYTPHITKFYDPDGRTVKEFSPAKLLTLSLDEIQPSQFYVDEEKIAAVGTFLKDPMDIIIQVMPYEGRFISLDGHTRLYYAVMKGWAYVRAVQVTAGEYLLDFVKEARRRNIRTPKDLELVSHREYEEKWYRFCDDYFAREEDIHE